MGCIPAKASGEFVAPMEEVLDVYQRPDDPQRPQVCEVLDVYQRPDDPQRPQVCMDETSKQLVGEVAQPLPLEPGQPQRYDYEYERNGVANLFLFFEPLTGQRFVEVTAQRTKVDWAHAVRDLVDIHYPEAQRIILVMDNLNTHTLGALYEAFAPVEAKRIADRLEIHYTPKHGSWLNMAEIEFGVLGRQCLDQRIPDGDTLRAYVAHWQTKRNQRSIRVDWRFTTTDARIKLKRLYPSIQEW
jgi:transposase